MTTNLGICPMNRFSWLQTRVPVGIEKVFRDTLSIAYFALVCCKARLWASLTVGATVIFLTNRLADIIFTANWTFPGVISTKSSFERMNFKDMSTPFSNSFSWKNKSACTGAINSTIWLSDVYSPLCANPSLSPVIDVSSILPAVSLQNSPVLNCVANVSSP